MDIRKRTAVKRFSMINLLVVLTLICCASLIKRSNPPSELELVRAAGELRVLSRNGPLSHYQGPEGLTGFEYSLLEGFARDIGVKLVLADEEQINDILQKKDHDKFDVVSPSAIGNQSLKERFRYSDSFLDVSLQLIYNNNQTAPSSLLELKGKSVVVVGKSAASIQLQKLQESSPDIDWNLVENAEMVDLLDMVERGTADYAIVDSAIFNIYRYSYPHTQLAFNVSQPEPLAWALNKSTDNSLYKAAQAYLAKIKHNGQLASTSAHFFDQYIEVNTDDALMFSLRFEKRFPRWAESIKAAAAQYDLDWQLVAAIGYQESQWIPTAESPTGVRGFMMLTPETAKELGVKNLDDPKQSINGGAKYIRNLLDTLPASIQGEDRLLMALAAYNQGIGHLDDARALTRRTGGNANKWEDVSKNFPLLTKQQYYSKAMFGYARGWEPVIYVKNVLNYQRILAFKEKQEKLRIATSSNSDDIFETKEPSALEKLNRIRLSSSSSVTFL